jgi:Na+-driven multidrug efflux pump
VGRTSTNADALAGMGSAAALLTFSFYLFNFLCTVTTPLVSQRRAAGDDNGAVEVGGQALSLAIILGASLTGVLTAFSQPLLDVMGTGSTGINANGYALSFLGIRAFAAPAVFLISASTGILRGYLDTKTTFVILLGANVVNFLLDVALIVGLDMGPAGAAIATTTAEWICAILLLFIVAGKFPSVDGKLGSNQHAAQIVTENISLSTPLVEGGNNSNDKKSPSFGKRRLQQEMVVITPTINLPTWDAMKPLVAASSSVFIRSFMLQLSLAGAAAMAARSGGLDSSETASASIAAHQIALQLWLLCSFVCDALAAASQALVADRLGREDPDGVRDVCKTILMYSLGLGIFLATSLGLGDISGFLLNLFTQDALTKEILQQLLVILIIAQPLNAYVFAADGILQGASLFSYEAKSMVFSVLFGISSFYSLQFFGGYNEYSANTLLNVWYSLVILQLARGGTSLWKLRERGGILDIFS